MLRVAVRAYDPGTVMFDTHAPRALVEDCKTDGRQAVLVLRQCRAALMDRMARDGTLQAFAATLLPHTRAEMSVLLEPATLRLLEAADSVKYVGGIVFPAPIDAVAVAAVSARHGLPAEARLLLLCAGSGGYGPLNRRFMEKASRALSAIAMGNRNVRVICVAGPYADTFPDIPGCQVIPSDPDLQALMARADLVVAHAGYNTLQEVLRVGTRAVLVPAYRRSEDPGALMRALLPRQGMKLVEHDSPESTFHTVCENLLMHPRPAPEARDGAELAAQIILEIGRVPDLYCYRHATASLLCSKGAIALSDAAQIIASANADARLSVDWDLLHKLLDMLDGASPKRVVSIEVHLGVGSPGELAKRAFAVHDLLVCASIDPHIMTLAGC